MIILGTNSIKDTGYDVANSLRFNSGSSDYLNRTLSTPTNRRKWTFSMWVKRSNISSASTSYLLSVNSSQAYVYFNTDDTFNIEQYSGGYQYRLKTNRVFRDTSAWYHLVIRFDSTNGTADDRVRIYINGVQETSFSARTNPSLNFDGAINNNNAHFIGRDAASYWGGYMSEITFIDGQSLDPTSFGEFDSDTGIWKPIDVSGLTFGTNGFYLDFENSGSLGADVSGNGNNFTVNNLTSIDQTTDTPTNNYCTMNPLNVPTSNQPTFSEGNLKTVSSSSPSGAFGGSTTFGVSQGKWYVEAKATVDSTYSRNAIGVTYNPAEMARSNADTQISNTSYAWGWESSGGEVRHDGSVVASYATYGTGDICQIFLDLDNHKLYFGKNGSLQSSTGISLDTGETYFIVQTDRTGSSATSTFEFNFGNPIYSISSSNTDGEYGNFEYSTTITGDGASKTFKALNTKNLAEYG